MIITSLSFFFVFFNGISLIAILKFKFAITIVVIMAKMAILAILAMTMCVINMAIMGI